jgi:DNA-binding NarL/FixJ family response regulator
MSGLSNKVGPAAALLKEHVPKTGDRAAGRYRVLVVDDHEMVRQRLRILLESYSELLVIGEATNGLEAISMAGVIRPDIVIMDVNMPIMNGIVATRHIKDAQPTTIVIGLSLNDSGQIGGTMLAAGADAFLLKDAASGKLYGLIAELTHR